MYILTPERYHLLYVSMIVYIIVNLFENVFYYSIGRHSNKEGIQIELPTRKDWTKILCVTFIFAVLQGYLTCLFN